MGNPVGAANNVVLNPSTLPTNTAKSPATATKNSCIQSKMLGKGDVSKSRRAVFKAADALSVEGGTSAELEKLSRVVMSGPTPLTDPWVRAMETDGLDLAEVKGTILPLLEDAKKDKCGGILLAGPRGQVTVECKSKSGFLGLNAKKVYIVTYHGLNSGNVFRKEVHTEISDELTSSILLCVCGPVGNNSLSPGSVSDADLDVPDETDDDADLNLHHLNDIDAEVRFACHHLIDNSDPAANLLRRTSIYETFDENVFRRNAGLTENRNRADSISDSVYSEGSDIYTRQSSETGNTDNEAAWTDERSNSAESGIPTVKIPRAKLSEQTTVKQRMPAANEDNLHVAGPDGLPLNTEMKKSRQSDTVGKSAPPGTATATKTTAGSTVESPSFVPELEGSPFRPNDSMHTFKVQISPDGVATTLGTLNGNESKSTPAPAPESPSGSPTGIPFRNTRRLIGQMESPLEKVTRKAVKNTLPKDTAGIEH